MNPLSVNNIYNKIQAKSMIRTKNYNGYIYKFNDDETLLLTTMVTFLLKDCNKNTKRKSFSHSLSIYIVNPSRPDHGRTETIKLNFYFHTSLWSLKRFYAGLKGLRKTF